MMVVVVVSLITVNKVVHNFQSLTCLFFIRSRTFTADAFPVVTDKHVYQLDRGFRLISWHHVSGVAHHYFSKVSRPLDVTGQFAVVQIPRLPLRPVVRFGGGEVETVVHVDRQRIRDNDVHLSAVEHDPVAGVDHRFQLRFDAVHKVRQHFVVDASDTGVLDVTDVQRRPDRRRLHVRCVRPVDVLLVVVEKVVQPTETGRAAQYPQLGRPVLPT